LFCKGKQKEIKKHLHSFLHKKTITQQQVK
jgi:hypothetical protein